MLRLEKSVRVSVRGYLNKLIEQGEPLWYAPYNPLGGGKPGTPDTLVCYYGLFVGIECKRPGRENEKNGGMSPLQAQQRREIVAAGGAHFLAYGREDVVKALNVIRAGLMGPSEDGPNGKKRIITTIVPPGTSDPRD